MKRIFVYMLTLCLVVGLTTLFAEESGTLKPKKDNNQRVDSKRKEDHVHKEQSPQSSKLTTLYTCKEHPDVVAFSKGVCPLCGEKLTKVDAPVLYFCPMIQQCAYHSNQPGVCPLCEMKLKKYTHNAFNLLFMMSNLTDKITKIMKEGHGEDIGNMMNRIEKLTTLLSKLNVPDTELGKDFKAAVKKLEKLNGDLEKLRDSKDENRAFQIMKDMKAAIQPVLEKMYPMNAICPICGEATKAKNHTMNMGMKVYFCSEECQKVFEKAPGKYHHKLPQFGIPEKTVD